MVAGVAGCSHFRAHMHFVIQVYCPGIGLLQLGEIGMIRIEVRRRGFERLVAGSAVRRAHRHQLRLDSTMLQMAARAGADG